MLKYEIRERNIDLKKKPNKKIKIKKYKINSSL
jgi:hypothetical protein